VDKIRGVIESHRNEQLGITKVEEQEVLKEGQAEEVVDGGGGEKRHKEVNK